MAIKRVNSYKTSDGLVHPNLGMATEHERAIQLQAIAEKWNVDCENGERVECQIAAGILKDEVAIVAILTNPMTIED